MITSFTLHWQCALAGISEIRAFSIIGAKNWFLCQWLLPSEAGYLEAEGLEDTRHFSQEAIVKEVDVTSARKAFDLQLPGFKLFPGSLLIGISRVMST